MNHEFAISLVNMRLIQTEKLLAWMAANTTADHDKVDAALDAVHTALAEVSRLEQATA